MNTICLLLATVTHWVVPATSEEQFLPDRDPVHAAKGGVVRIVAAKGEYVPGDCVVMGPRQDFKKWGLSLIVR